MSLLKLSSLFICLSFSLGAHTKEFYESNRLYDKAKEICAQNPKANLAVVLHQTDTYIGELNKKGECKKPKCKVKTKYKYNSLQVELQNLISNSKLIGKYFRVLDGVSDEPVSLDCSNLRATNVYYHLNYIHELFLEKMLPYFPANISEYLESQYPIDVRINLENQNDFIHGFSKTKKIYNTATTTCGRLEKTDKYRFVEKPEILFFKPNWEKGGMHFSPLCMIDYFKNQYPCSSDPAIDNSLIAGSIFHEYIHLITDKSLNQCRTNMLGESYSIFSSLLMNPAQQVGKGLPAGITHHTSQAEFADKLVPYKKESEEIDDLWLEESGGFGFSLMGKYFESLNAPGGFNKIESWRMVLQSSFRLRTVNGDKIPKVIDLPKAMSLSCEHVSSDPALCLERVEKVSNRYF